MALLVSKDQFDWRGPASTKEPKPFSRRIMELFVPPKGEKVLPTASGMMLILIGLCLGLAAYNTENNILFIALSLLIATIVMSGIFCWSNIISARWRLENSSTFRVGETGEVAVVVENARQRFPLFSLLFELGSDKTEEFRELHLRDSVAPGESARLVWRYKPERRCRTKIRILETTSLFPFGFLKKHVPGGCVSEVSIWPARIEYRRLKNLGSGFGWQGASTKARGTTGELIGLREYSRGDAPRSIHWKVSARQGALVVKQNAAESQARYTLHVSHSKYLWPTKEIFERMCSFVVSLAEDLFLAGDLDYCRIEGGPEIKISRVSDLSTFFDQISSLEWDADSGGGKSEDAGNAVSFRPVDGIQVAAYLNGKAIAKA
ncbi:MAG: hypothetical protein CMI15_07085 [Opitutaceae bacterium]|nr:hypothetical protein [Opitutaceae bacterium]